MKSDKNAGETSVSRPSSKSSAVLASSTSSEVVARIVAEIDEMIEQGVLVPGQRVVEPDIMRRLDVGRMPVREALRILAGDGVIQLSSGQSARVCELSRERLQDMMEFIGAMTELSIKMFVSRGLNDVSRRELEDAWQDIQISIKQNSVANMLKSMNSFHEVISKHSHNSYVEEVLGRFHVKNYRRQLADLLSASDVIKGAKKYKKLMSCLMKEDLRGSLRANAEISGPFLDKISVKQV